MLVARVQFYKYGTCTINVHKYFMIEYDNVKKATSYNSDWIPG